MSRAIYYLKNTSTGTYVMSDLFNKRDFSSSAEANRFMREHKLKPEVFKIMIMYKED